MLQRVSVVSVVVLLCIVCWSSLTIFFVLLTFGLRHLRCYPGDKFECGYCNKFFSSGALYQHQSIFCMQNPNANVKKREKIKMTNKERCRRYSFKKDVKHRKQVDYVNSCFNKEKNLYFV